MKFLLLTIFATSTLSHITFPPAEHEPLRRDNSMKRLVNAVERSRTTGSYPFDFDSELPLMAQLLGIYTVTTNNYYSESAEDGDLNILKSGQDVTIKAREGTLLFYTSGRVIASLPTNTIATAEVQSTWGSPRYISLTRYRDAFGVLDGSRVHSIPSVVLSAKRHCWDSTWRRRATKLAIWLRQNSEVFARSAEQRLPVVIPDETFAADNYANEVGHVPGGIPWPFLAEQDPDEYTRYINKAHSIGKAEKLGKGRLFWNMLAQTLHSQDKKDLKDGEEMTPWPQIENQWSYYKQAAEKDSGDLELYLTGMPSNISAIEASRKKMVEAMTEYIEDNPEATLKQYLHSSESRLRSMDYETQLLQPNDDPDWTFAMQYTKCWGTASEAASGNVSGGYAYFPYYFPVQQAALDSGVLEEILEDPVETVERLNLEVLERLRGSGENSDRNKQSEVVRTQTGIILKLRDEPCTPPLMAPISQDS